MAGVHVEMCTLHVACRATFLWLGAIEKVGTIPAKSTHFSASECKVQLRPGCEEVHVVASIPHAHATGTAVWSEMYSRGADGSLSYVRASQSPCRTATLRL